VYAQTALVPVAATATADEETQAEAVAVLTG
jgi:hypothetical protein